MITLEQADFECVGQIAKHCDNDKLCIAIDEAKTFDLNPLLCEMYPSVNENWDSEDEIWTDLIDGSDYTDCKGRTKSHLGVKRVLIYYAYSRYLFLNGFNDTPNGSVRKTNNFSIPTPLAEVKTFADKYRDMGFEAFKGVKDFLCRNASDYEDFNSNNCSGCGCYGSECGGTKIKGYGFRGANVDKYGV